MKITNIHFANLMEKSSVGICATMILIAGFTFIYSIYQWREDWVLAHQQIALNPVIPLQNEEPEENLALLKESHLFGQSLAKIGEVPITNLQLQVTGIVKIPGEHTDVFSKAYISIAGQASKIYRVGDSLPYGVKVYAITPDTVILENDNHLEKLSMLREKLKFNVRKKKEMGDV